MTTIMHDAVRRSITNALQCYVAEGRKHGFTDEELREVCEATWHDSIQAINRAARGRGPIVRRCDKEINIK